MKTPIKETSIKQRAILGTNSINNSENLKSVTKRNSIKNYLMLKNSKILEDDKNNEQNPKIKEVDNITHSRIKNYLRNKNIDETGGNVGELSINIGKSNINKNNNVSKNTKTMRESKSSYDVFKKAPL